MAYIGATPTVGNFQVCDAISVVNGQAAYTLQVGGVNVTPESANHMLVSLNGILQKPGSSFTVSGSTITFASNLATGDSIDFVQILGNVLDIGQPSDDTVTAAKLATTSITGQTAETSAADADTILIHDASASALKKMTRSNFLSGVGGANTPAFQARISSTQNLSDATYVKMAAATEDFDTDGTYDHSTNYRFTPGVAGKFMFYGMVNFDSSSTDDLLEFAIALYKNGTRIASTYMYPASTKHYIQTSNFTFVDTSDDDDYYECFLYLDITSNTPQALFESSVGRTYWGAYKIIT